MLWGLYKLLSLRDQMKLLNLSWLRVLIQQQETSYIIIKITCFSCIFLFIIIFQHQKNTNIS